eukprot:Opistho-2@74360
MGSISAFVSNADNRKRILLVTWSMVMMAACGTIYAYNAFADELKKRMDYSQSQAELIVSIGNIGICIGAPAGMFMDRYGPRRTAAVGAVLSFLGYFLMYAAVRHMIHVPFGVVCLFYFIVGQGSIFTYMPALMSVVASFDTENRGKVVGLVDAMFGASAAIFSSIYTTTFEKSDDNQDLPGFLLLLALLSFGVDVVAALTMQVIPFDRKRIASAVNNNSGTDSSADGLVSARESDPLLGSGKGRDDVRFVDPDHVTIAEVEAALHPMALPVDITGFQILANIDFQLMFWMFTLAGGAGLMFMDNITFMLTAFDLSSHKTLFVTIIPVASSVARFSSGVLSDHILARVPRSRVLLSMLVLLSVTQVLLVFWMDRLAVLLIGAIAVGASYGTLWCITPTMVAESFGLKHFGQNWGWLMLSSAVGALGYQYMLAAVYDEHKDSGEKDCYGFNCYFVTMIVSAATCALATAMNCLLDYREVRRRRLAVDSKPHVYGEL